MTAGSSSTHEPTAGIHVEPAPDFGSRPPSTLALADLIQVPVPTPRGQGNTNRFVRISSRQFHHFSRCLKCWTPIRGGCWCFLHEEDPQTYSDVCAMWCEEHPPSPRTINEIRTIHNNRCTGCEALILDVVYRPQAPARARVARKRPAPDMHDS